MKQIYTCHIKKKPCLYLINQYYILVNKSVNEDITYKSNFRFNIHTRVIVNILVFYINKCTFKYLHFQNVIELFNIYVNKTTIPNFKQFLYHKEKKIFIYQDHKE